MSETPTPAEVERDGMSGALEQVYTDHLAGMALRECPNGYMWWREKDGSYRAAAKRLNPRPGNSTLADALYALLTDLDANPPDRVTVEQVRARGVSCSWRVMSRAM